MDNKKIELKAIWITPEVHDLLWQYKVKFQHKSIGDVASKIIKEVISKELGNE